MRSLCLAVLLLFAVLELSEGRRIRPSTYNCTAPPESGTCRAAFRRWYHDPQDSTCKQFSWGGCGGNDNRFYSQSACERYCVNRTARSNCSPVICRKYCQFGFMVDEHNCPFCACRANPDCPQIECPDPCPNGYQVDENGCSSCFCRPTVQHMIVERAAAESCPPVCAMFCPNGMKQDENGCPICQCLTKEEACGAIQCRMHCEFGFKKDHRGCDVCECNQSGNRTHSGGRRQHHQDGGRHQHGRNRDSGRRPGIPAQLPESTVSCPAIRCKLHCRNGYVKDSFGCRVCRCSTGRRPGAEDGAPSRRRQMTTQTPGECGPSIMCMMHCENGFKKGPDGCDICQCA